MTKTIKILFWVLLVVEVVTFSIIIDQLLAHANVTGTIVVTFACALLSTPVIIAFNRRVKNKPVFWLLIFNALVLIMVQVFFINLFTYANGATGFGGKEVDSGFVLLVISPVVPILVNATLAILLGIEKSRNRQDKLSPVVE